jgi:acyl carrier protein
MSIVEEKIRDLFAALLQVSPDEVKDETRPASLERWDSMQHLILVSGFEEEFGLDIDPEEAVEMYKDFATFKRIVLHYLSTKS